MHNSIVAFSRLSDTYENIIFHDHLASLGYNWSFMYDLNREKEVPPICRLIYE
jgi:hypothetical protein